MLSIILFAICLLVIATGLVSPPIALAMGVSLGLLALNPCESQGRKWAKILLQVSVVALGFGIDFSEVLRVGKVSFLYTAISICAALALGLALGKLLNVRPKASFLIAAGTAICGGSAIAALAPITQPNEEELAISLGTVFTLNSVALLLFPPIGVALHVSQTQFGLWSALAIHDTSSVVGAAAKFGAQALAIGTVVKLTRALWIVPVAIVTAMVTRTGARVQIPWFIGLFCLAAVAKTQIASAAPLFNGLAHLGHIGLAFTLFLIGGGITVKTIQQAGARVMAQGVTLWVAVSVVSLLLILQGTIHL